MYRLPSLIALLLLALLAACAPQPLSVGDAAFLLTESAFTTQISAARTATADADRATSTAVIRATEDSYRFRETQIAQDRKLQDLALTQSAATATAGQVQTQSAATDTARPPAATAQAVATATQAAADRDRRAREADAWFWLTAVAAVAVVVVGLLGLKRLLDSRAVEAEQRAAALATKAEAEADRIRREAAARSMVIYKIRNYVIVIVDGQVTDKQFVPQLPAPAGEQADELAEPPGLRELPEVIQRTDRERPLPDLSRYDDDTQRLLAFLARCRELAPEHGASPVLPSAAAYGDNGERQPMINELKRLGLIKTLPGRENGGTYLRQHDSLDQLIDEVRAGQVRIALPHETIDAELQPT
jgi:hypothetical protein